MKVVRCKKQDICIPGLFEKSSALIVPTPSRGLLPVKDKSSSGTPENNKYGY